MKFTSNLISKTEAESRRKRRIPGIENPAMGNSRFSDHYSW